MAKRPCTARDYVLGTLRTEILKGEHQAGARLKQEEVASRLGVSTTPVREAFRDLLAEGLIGLDTHRGALVRGLTLADVRELYELRIVLEPMLARRAVALATSEHLADAEALQTRLSDERDPERWAALNVIFHQLLNATVSEGRLPRIVTSLAEAAGSYVSLSMHATPELMTLNNADHVELLRLYRLKDEDGAAARTAAHLKQTLLAIERDVQGRSVAQETVAH
jgi:DNA-binding GntR family transcriptional regulator